MRLRATRLTAISNAIRNLFAGAALDLNFAGATALDPRITFTRASTATFFNSSGVLQTAAENIPRLDHDPVTLKPKGLLIEEQRTNLLVRSDDFANASWGKTRASITSNVIVAPDGTLTGDKLVEDTTANSIHQTQQPVGAGSVVSYTLTCYAKAAERSRFGLVFVNGTGGFAAFDGFDLVSGTTAGSPAVSLFTSVSVSIQNVGNGWYRCALTATPNDTSTLNAVIRLTNGSTATYTGNGTSGIFIWGAQLEAGAFPTSYIPTTGTAATRAADVAVMTGTNFSSWYRQDEGSVYAEVSTPQLVSAARYFQMDDGTDSVFMGTGITSTQVRFRGTAGGGTDQYDLATGVVAANAVVKAAGGFKVNDFALSVNGGAATTDTLGTLCTPNTMRIGQALAGSQLNGHIRRIAFFPRRLSNAELQSLTA